MPSTTAAPLVPAPAGPTRAATLEALLDAELRKLGAGDMLAFVIGDERWYREFGRDVPARPSNVGRRG